MPPGAGAWILKCLALSFKPGQDPGPAVGAVSCPSIQRLTFQLFTAVGENSVPWVSSTPEAPFLTRGSGAASWQSVVLPESHPPRPGLRV